MSIINRVAERMILHENGDKQKIAHFLKVTMYARLIALGTVEDEAQRELIEIAALTHDIGIKPALEKHGSAAGPLQEKEGPPVAEPMLRELGVEEDKVQRISWLIGHHHTLDPIEGIDHQILIEADYLVNADEQGVAKDRITEFRDKYFKTETGTRMLHEIFQLGAD